MATTDPSTPLARNKFLFVLVLFLLLMGLAHGAAEWSASKDARAAEEWREQLKATPAGATAAERRTGQLLPAGPVVHTVVYYRIIFTIWVTVVLVTPAFCFYVLQRPAVTAVYWRLFWTFSYLAFLTHFYWAFGVLFGWDFQEMLHSKSGMNPNPEKVVDNPIPDLVLTVWWGVDVLLAWAITRNPTAVQLQRGLLQLVAFAMFVGATVIAPKAGVEARLLGIVLFLAVTVCFALMVVLRPADPGSFLMRVYGGFFRILNLILPWYRLPTWLGVMNLGTLRDVLREKNLTGTADIPVTNPQGRTPEPGPASAEDLRRRNVDGYYNDLRKPEMGSASENTQNAAFVPGPGKIPPDPGDFDRANPGARFGRNIPHEASYPDEAQLLVPNPREISRQLLARDTFKPAGILNFVAAAWIQFETHDWFFHGNPIKGKEFRVPLPPGDDWAKPDDPNREMHIRRTRPDPTRDYDAEKAAGPDRPPPPTYANAGSHWWDASQIYGDDAFTAKRLRQDPDGNLCPHGKFFLDKNQLPIDPANPDSQIVLTGFTGNWWAGLSLLHTLFAREHNAICDHLHVEYPHWDGERLYQTARLVNAALMAKIHTVEWTPAILPNPALQIGMNANWWGVLTEPIKKVFGRLSENEAFSGITGSVVNHHAADYSLTEEFVSVYRMHPLIRDDLPVCSATTGAPIKCFDVADILGFEARKRFEDAGATLTDLFYSFGTCPPGALVLRNYPQVLRNFKRPDEDRIDLGSIDILRDRERGVPRYNAMRAFLHLPRFRSIDHMIGASEQLGGDPDLAKELRRIYGNEIERVDLMVGMFAETPPPLFGFSDTAFRIFVLMASRRLKSDRFFTTDFTEAVYSPAGFAWVNDNTMRTVLLRHYPDLAPALRGVTNAFAPWRTINDSRAYQPHELDPI
jgi:hypothetical protein